MERPEVLAQLRSSPAASITGGALIAGSATVLFFRYPGRWLLGNHLSIPGDFGVYLLARGRVFQGIDPYIPAELSPFKYAPATLWFLNFLPEDSGRAWLVYGTLSLLLWAAAVALGARPANWRAVGLLTLGIILSWKGMLETLDYGQTEFYLFFLAVISAALFRKRPFISGLSLGLMPMFKLPWLFLLVPFLLRIFPSPNHSRQAERSFRDFSSGYFLSIFTWSVVIPALTFGPERAKVLTQSWVKLLRTQPSDLYLNEINQSLLVGSVRVVHYFSKVQGVPLLAFGLTLVLAGWILALLTFRMLRRERSLKSRAALDLPFLWLSPWLILGQLLNPLAWRWGSVFLIGAPFSAEKGRGLQKVIWVGILLLFLLQQSPFVQLLGFHHWTDLHGFGLITGYWLLLVLC